MIGKIGGNMNRKGQALIEFVLILPMLLLVTLGVFDYVNIQNTIDNSTFDYRADIDNTAKYINASI